MTTEVNRKPDGNSTNMPDNPVGSMDNLHPSTTTDVPHTPATMADTLLGDTPDTPVDESAPEEVAYVSTPPSPPMDYSGRSSHMDLPCTTSDEELGEECGEEVEGEERSSELSTTPCPDLELEKESDLECARKEREAAESTDPMTMYERKIFHGRVSNKDFHLLKEALRAKHGFPLKEKKTPQCIDIRRPPRRPPRSNLTSRRRMEVQRHRLIVRCTNILRALENYNRLTELPQEESRCVFEQLRTDIMNRTREDLDLEMELQELSYLKSLAEKERNNIVCSRDNRVSTFRYQHNRGQPIISSYFRENFDGYQRPPFIPAWGKFKLTTRNLPEIDKDHEIWLVPIEDNDTPSILAPACQPQLSEESNDRRSKRAKARPPLRKKGKRVVREDISKQRKENSGNRKKTRPPWRRANALSCLYARTM